MNSDNEQTVNMLIVFWCWR